MTSPLKRLLPEKLSVTLSHTNITNEQGSLLWVLFFTPSTAEAVPLPLRMEAVPPQERLSVTLSHIEANCFSDINPANLRYAYGAIFPYGSDMLCGA